MTRRSFVELGARERARALLDSGTLRELIDPFQRVMSPWLSRQGVVPQADDGVVIAKRRHRRIAGGDRRHRRQLPGWQPR
ncbi:MAG: Malonyl-S-ACP:biotin-protein carboxyltransferase MADC [Pseudomonas fluorescens]|nr:MAG: Malonyl-S-ACP:biotin-protein carboxyltransferase MADC [Pseudomonas fluorescens]